MTVALAPARGKPKVRNKYTELPESLLFTDKASTRKSIQLLLETAAYTHNIKGNSDLSRHLGDVTPSAITHWSKEGRAPNLVNQVRIQDFWQEVRRKAVEVASGIDLDHQISVEQVVHWIGSLERLPLSLNEIHQLRRAFLKGAIMVDDREVRIEVEKYKKAVLYHLQRQDIALDTFLGAFQEYEMPRKTQEIIARLFLKDEMISLEEKDTIEPAVQHLLRVRYDIRNVNIA